MVGSNSQYSTLDKNPKKYIGVPGEDDSGVFYEKRWRIEVDGYSTCFDVTVCRPFAAYRTYEFVYQIIVINKCQSRRKEVIQGVGKLKGFERFCSENIHNWHPVSIGTQFNFQAVAYAIIEDNRLRKMNFVDENVYGKSMTVLTTGKTLQVPVQTINKGAPLLAKYVLEKKPNPKLSSCSEEFFQVFHGVHAQLKKEEIKTLLKFAAKFQVLNVKRHCEQQLIRREDLNVSEKRKFKMACEFNLNILMNQVLRNVKTVRELAKLASIAIEMKSMDTNISKLLIARMYQVLLPPKE